MTDASELIKKLRVRAYDGNPIDTFNSKGDLMLSAADMIAKLEDLLGRYADEVGAANGIYFELVGPEGDYIVELGERVASAREAEPKPKHTGQYSVPQSRN
jgi:hypothetical protein